MTHEELIERIKDHIYGTRYTSDKPGHRLARAIAIDILADLYEALREVTPAMVEAWETAGPIPGYGSPEYQRANDPISIDGYPEFISRAHATGNWLDMLDASPLKPPEPPERS